MKTLSHWSLKHLGYYSCDFQTKYLYSTQAWNKELLLLQVVVSIAHFLYYHYCCCCGCWWSQMVIVVFRCVIQKLSWFFTIASIEWRQPKTMTTDTLSKMSAVLLFTCGACWLMPMIATDDDADGMGAAAAGVDVLGIVMHVEYWNLWSCCPVD